MDEMIGKLDKYKSDIAKNVRNMAFRGLMDQNGSIFGTSKILGYVCAIHGDDDENVSLRGTIDVQEYNYDENEGEVGAGFHEGVLISAIQNNKDGYRIIPQLYSDVIIVQEPSSLEEYVLMYSHVKIVQILSCEEINIGVVEREPIKETDNGLEKDYDELNETGNKSMSHYDSQKIRHSVANKKGESYIKVAADGLELNGNESNAVRYKELCSFLKKLCKYLETGKVPSQGAPLDTAPQIGAMASEIEKMMSKSVKLS